MMESELRTFIAPIVESLGYRLVRVSVQTQRRMNLQIMIERLDDFAISVEDCARVSRHLSTIFDAEDIIKTQFVLEVSSPGIDRPLVGLNDFTRFTGLVAQAKLHKQMGNSKKIVGRIVKIDGDNITFAHETIKAKTKEVISEEIVVNIENISSAKLILTDELLDLAQNGQLPGSKIAPIVEIDEGNDELPDELLNDGEAKQASKRTPKGKKPVKLKKDHKKTKGNKLC